MTKILIIYVLLIVVPIMIDLSFDQKLYIQVV